MIDDLIESTMIFLRADDEARQSIGEALESGRVQLEEAVNAFDELVAQWENVRGERGPPPSVEPLFARIDGALGLVEEHTSAFSSAVGELEEANRDLQTGLKRRILLGTVIGAFLLAWQAVAQWSLACWGWRKTRPADCPWVQCGEMNLYLVAVTSRSPNVRTRVITIGDRNVAATVGRGIRKVRDNAVASKARIFSSFSEATVDAHLEP